MHWLKLLQYLDAAGNMVIRDFHQSETLSVHHELRRMLKLSPLVEMVAVPEGIGVWEKGEDAEAESVAEQCELCCRLPQFRDISSLHPVFLRPWNEIRVERFHLPVGDGGFGQTQRVPNRRPSRSAKTCLCLDDKTAWATDQIVCIVVEQSYCVAYHQ